VGFSVADILDLSLRSLERVGDEVFLHYVVR
jgi:hypothetical protein